MSWSLLIIELVVGCGLLAWSADRFIKGCVAIAQCFHVSQLVVGMVLIGFGTSCPELIVSFLASFKGNPGIAIGNVLGSNIANIALVSGVAALFAPMLVQRKVLYREFPFLFVVTLIVGAMFYQGFLSRLEGVVLLILFIIYMTWMFRAARRDNKNSKELKNKSSDLITHSLAWGIMWFLLGLLVMLGSAELIVRAASGIARQLGLSDVLVGLTIVAIGTSLPELAATITSCLKKQYDLGVGNVVGSSLFNSLAVLCVPALLAPGKIDATLFSRDFPVLLIVTVLFWLLVVLPPRREWLNRWGGGVLVLVYLAYLSVLITVSI